jgi:hypothetical protein
MSLETAICRKAYIDEASSSVLVAAVPAANESLLSFRRRQLEPRPLSTAPRVEALADQRRCSSGPLGGNGVFTDLQFAYLRHLILTANMSMEKAVVTLFSTGFYFTGRVPFVADIPPKDTLRYAFIRLYLADKAHAARILLEYLIANPYAAVTVALDDTPSEGGNYKSIFLRFPKLPPNGAVSQYA